MARTLNQILGGLPMTAAAQVVKRGLPNTLPPAFLNVTRRVPGNVVKYSKVSGGQCVWQPAQPSPSIRGKFLWPEL